MFQKFFISLIFLFSLTSSVFAAAFSDVPDNHKNFTAIESLKKYGIIKGYSDSTFRPEAEINRAEALKLIILGSGIDVKDRVDFSGFSDVPPDAWFAPILIKAKNLGIIKGDISGNFSAHRNINLAETLKILLHSHGVILPFTIPNERPYADVPINEWYSLYFQYAKDHNLIDAQKNENIFPGDAATRGEIAELIYRLRNALEEQKQTLSLASYYSQSLQGNITASGEKYNPLFFTAAHRTFDFGTRLSITNTLNNKSVIVRVNDRGPSVPGRALDLSQAAFEAISPLSKGFIPVVIREIIVADTPLADTVPIKDDCHYGEVIEPVSKDYFMNDDEEVFIELFEDMPSFYLENEVHDIAGKVFDEDIKEVFAVIKNENGRETIFSTPVKSGNFLLQLHFGLKGDKDITFLTDLQGKNYSAPIAVYKTDCAKILTKETSTGSQNYRFAIENNEVKFRWDISGANLSRVIFQQGDRTLIRYFSNKKQGWNINFQAFESFSQGEFYVRVDLATSSTGELFDRTTSWKEGEKKLYHATEHHFSVYDPSDITIEAIPYEYGKGGEISFQGKAEKNIIKNVGVLTPKGKKELIELVIDGSDFDSTTISKNTLFSFIYKPQETGTYILEIQSELKNMSLNIPVYELGSIPIIPDFIDKKSLSRIDSVNNIMSASVLLNLMNQERQSALQQPLEISEDLSKLAQMHADDIALNGVISYETIAGENIDDLRLNFGIKTNIVENIQKASSMLHAHELFMRSFSGRKNILLTQWENIGIGFALNSDKELIVVEVFSSKPIELEDTNMLREEVLEMVNSQREKLLVPSANFIALAQMWSDKMAVENFFDFADLENQSFANEIRKAGIVQTVGTFIIGNTSWEEVISMLMEHEEIFSGRWKKLGVGITQDNDGIIKVTLLYSE